MSCPKIIQPFGRRFRQPVSESEHQLEGDPDAALAAAPGKDLPPARGSHSMAKTVFVLAFPIAGLKRPLHQEMSLRCAMNGRRCI